MKTVREVMTREVECCTLLDNVYEVAVKMRDWNVGGIPVVDGDQLIGMITDRDLVVRGYAEKNPGSTKVEKVMTNELITIESNATAKEAAEIMAKHQIRRLPVVENGRLVGIVTLGDLATRKFSDEHAGRALSDISEPGYNGLQH